jgi:sporulation protein YlmC with PRC-barrel domain
VSPKAGKATERWLGEETCKRRQAMESGQPRSNLTKLSETDLPLEEPWQDMRGLDVYDIQDDQIGSVEDLYVDRELRLASYLVVSAGGFLGIGKKHFLVPVEEVSRDVGEERVTVTVPKDKVLNSPEFDPDLGVPDADLQRAIDAYYGLR